LFLTGQSQGAVDCAQSELHQHRLSTDPTYREAQELAEKKLLQLAQNRTSTQRAPVMYTLPVVFHIIHDGGIENISDDQVLDGLQHLNDAFANVGYYDPSTGVDVEIQFCLAQRDPQGEATTGIERVQSPLTDLFVDTDDQNMKDLSRYDPLQYINIWVVREIDLGDTGALGYAYLPGAHGADFDGIVMRYDYTGVNPTRSAVIAHEMGHYLGLYHTFEGGCTNNNCQTDGDLVCDTPPDNSTARPPCEVVQNTCSSDVDDLSPNNPFRPIANGGLGDQPDLHENYMDYTRHECRTLFTAGQAARMQDVVANIRSSLLDSPACINPCPAPVEAAFSLSADSVFLEEALTTTNLSANAVNYEWYIDGELVSTSPNLDYVISSVGEYEVELVAYSSNADFCLPVSSTQQVSVVCPVEVSITPTNSVLVPGATASFQSSTAGAEDYQWQVDGELMGTAPDFEFTTETSGLYDVCLQASNELCGNEVCALVQVGNASNCETTFYLTLGEPGGTNEARAVVQSNDNKFYIGGGTGNEAIIAKFEPDGEQLWARTFDFTDKRDIILSMQQDEDGMLFGTASALGVSKSGALVFRYNPVTDELLWVNYHDDQGELRWVEAKPEGGNYVAMGFHKSTMPSQRSLVIMEIDRITGETLWRRFYISDLDGTDDFSNLSIHDGHLYVSGDAFESGDRQVALYSFDLEGNLEWARSYLDAPSSEQTGKGVKVVEDGLVSALYTHEPGDVNNPYGGVLKTDFDGVPQWYKEYEVFFEDWLLRQIVQTSDGFLLLGTTYDFALDQNRIVLVRIDLEGNVIWANAYEGNGLQAGLNGGPQLAELNGYYYLGGRERVDNQGVFLRVRADNGQFEDDSPCPFLQPLDVNVVTFDNPPTVSFSPQEVNPDVVPGQLLSNTSTAIEWLTEAPCAPEECPEPCLFDFTVRADTVFCVDGQLQATIQVCNSDEVAYTGPLPVVIYDGNPTSTSATALDTLDIQVQNIAGGNCDTVSVLLPVSEGTLYFSVNDSALVSPPFDPTLALARFPKECDYLNNLDSLSFTPPIPEVDLGPDIEVCENSAVPLDAGAGFDSYRWRDGSTDQVFTAFEPGTYWVEATNACGLTASDTITITMTDPVAIDLLPEIAFICPEDTATIALEVADGYEIQWLPTEGLSCSDCAEVEATPDQSTVYTVTAITPEGCISADSVLVNVIPCEQVVDTAVCVTDSLLLFGKYFFPNAPDTVSSNTGDILLVKAVPLDTVLSYQDTLVCFGESLFMEGVTLLPGEESEFVYPLPNGCDSTVILRVVERPQIMDTTSVIICQGDTALIFGTPQTLAGLYAEQFTAVSGCDSTHYIQLTVLDTPSVNVPLGLLSCETGDGSLLAMGAGGSPPYAYEWGDGATSNENRGLVPGQYSITVTDSEGCNTEGMGTVLDSFPVLNLQAVSDSASCFNTSDGVLIAEVLNGGTPPYRYSLDGRDFQSSPVFGGLPEGSYNLYVQDAETCSDSVSASIGAPPAFSLSLPPDTTLQLGESLEIVPTYGGMPDFFRWEPERFLDCADCPSTVATPMETTRYQLTIGNSENCTLTEAINLFVEKPRRVYIPNALSPNDDGVNDVFRLYPSPSVERILRTRIFDRWGALVFEAYDYLPDDSQPAWDGTYRGEAMQSGVFTYMIEVQFIDGAVVPFTGALHLVR
jgi:gliding motility-associated-like protein